MDLVDLMYKYINRFINSDELLNRLENLNLSNFTDEEKVSINKLINDIKIIKDKTANEIDEIEKNRLATIEKFISDINKILESNLEKDIKEKIEKRKKYFIEEKKKTKDGGKLYKKIYIILADNDLINYYWDSMSDYELLEFIAKYISVPMPPQIDQEKFEKIVKAGIEKDEREWLWRLALNYSKRKFDYSLIEDYYIKIKDDYYLTELICTVPDEIDINKIRKKVMDTNDEIFIAKVKNTLKNYSIEI